LESRIDNLIIDLDLFAFLGPHEEFEDEIKKIGSDQDGCFTSIDVAMGNYQLS
jgi:hypothetical protein